MNIPGFLRDKVFGESATSASRIATLFAVVIPISAWAYTSIRVLEANIKLITEGPLSFSLPDVPENLAWIIASALVTRVGHSVLQKMNEKKGVSVETTTETKTVTVPNEGGTT